MQVATFYADCNLPAKAAAKAAGFDWRGAIRLLDRTARESLGAGVVTITDETTVVDGPIIRAGNAKADGVMLWLMDAQAAAIRGSIGNLLMISPDTLIAGPLDMMFGDWDVCLLTRERPKVIVNSVIAVKPDAFVAEFWEKCARAARNYSPEARAWGVDIDVLVDAIGIRPNENCVRVVDGVRFRLMPMAGIFKSVDCWGPVRRPMEPIWDFKGQRKTRMPEYAALL